MDARADEGDSPRKRALFSLGSLLATVAGIPFLGVAVSVAFAMSGFFAGVAGILIAPLFTISSTMGTMFGIKAFAVAILGGITNPWGVMCAGLLYGVAEALITASFGSTYTQITAFSLVIVALALRPEGLFGRAGVKKV